jgi:hypothetical protein
MKLNVGVSRKVGLPDYSSVGASCNLELEIDSGLIDRDLEAFHARVRDTYVAAHQAVHDELARLQAPGEPRTEAPDAGSSSRPGGNGHGSDKRSNHPSRFQEAPSRGRKPATPSQVKAIMAIARRQNADLVGMLRQEFEATDPEELTLKQASELIDLLKGTERT